MYAYSVWINQLYEALRLGCVVGIREALDDYDDETEQYVCIYTQDRQFRVKGGKVYCKGGSIMFPRPVTGEDGWEVEPLEDPHRFFEGVLDGSCVQDVYILCDNNTRVPIWNNQSGWLSKQEIIKHAFPTSFFDKCVEEKVNPLSSLKALAGFTAWESMDQVELKEIGYFFDDETRNHLLKPLSWWVPL